MIVVGERINTSRKMVNQAVEERNAAYIQKDILAQLDGGADFLDVNAGSRKHTEVEDLIWLIDVIQEAAPNARLCLDSPNPQTLKAVIGKTNQVPMLNSITGEKERFKQMAPLLMEFECEIIALCVDDRGIPKNADQVLENAAYLVHSLREIGMPMERIYLDTVLIAVSTNYESGLVSFDTLRRTHSEFIGVNSICGLSNISFGMPNRPLINSTYLCLAMEAGLTSAICDPLNVRLMETLYATNVLLGRDPWCQKYTSAVRRGRFNA
jgi:5-methyltetrahydrofolate--homocysteine methyltransferase